MTGLLAWNSNYEDSYDQSSSLMENWCLTKHTLSSPPEMGTLLLLVLILVASFRLSR